MLPRSIRPLAAALFAIFLTAVCFADDAPTTQPAPTSNPDVQAAVDDLAQASQQMGILIPTPDDLFDPMKRAAVAPQMIVLLKRIDGDFAQLSQLQPQLADQALTNRVQIHAMLDIYGDGATYDELKKLSAGSTPNAIPAKSSLILADWWRTNTDTTAQQNAVDQLQQLAHDHPDDLSVAAAAVAMVQSKNNATPDLNAQLRKILRQLQAPQAQAIVQELDAQDKLDALQGKPLIVTGTLLGGKPFSTADWKGKVVLVDFWATWCPPCVESLPDLAKAYSDYHAKGLEIVGVSNDVSQTDLQTFLTAHPEVAWPQLFDPAAAKAQQWNPISLGYGVNSIPTIFLIDKKGIVRNVDAEGKLNDLIPQMLQESAN
jgi:thiol-disulfide isomerase/thioredoxin